MSNITLILGGCRSGKSARAEELALESNKAVTYIATYLRDPSDAEMASRVQQHQSRRPANWKTIENRLDLTKMLQEESENVVLLDSLTLWLSARHEESNILEQLTEALKSASQLIVVSDDLSGGLAPADGFSRAFRDLSGEANQLVAKRANRVEYLIAGIPQLLKG